MRPNHRSKPVLDRAVPRLERFEPMAPVAMTKVRELLAREAVLVQVSRDRVQLLRHGITATVDTWGRVVWAVG